MPLADLPDTFTYTEARKAGLSKHALYRLRDSGQLEPIGRGLYRRHDAPLGDLDLLVVAQRSPMATLCLTSALARHDLTDLIPCDMTSHSPAGHGTHMGIPPSTGTVSTRAHFALGGRRSHSTMTPRSGCTAPSGPLSTLSACGLSSASKPPTKPSGDGCGRAGLPLICSKCRERFPAPKRPSVRPSRS